MGKNKSKAPTLTRNRYMCSDLTHAPVATAARAGTTGLVSMSTRPDREGSGSVEIATRRTNAPTGRVDRIWTKSGGKAPSPGFWLVGELAQVPHDPDTRASPDGYLQSGRVDMLTSPVAAARAAVAKGAWVKSKHDMYLIRGSVGA